jgi:glycine/D-amino acid oxidase-like deaminating enzyme
MLTADAVVIGGGVIGTSIAYRLALQGRKTIVVERGPIGAATSGSCDKAIFLQSKRQGIHLELAKESRLIYEQLEDELGIPFEFQRSGGMIVIETDAQLEAMKAFVQAQRDAGVPVQLLDRKEALVIQPVLSPRVVGATWCAEDAEVNPLKLTHAFALASSRLGSRVMAHTEVTGITCRQGKVTEVITSQGKIATEVVVNACGPFSPSIGEMVGVSVPIRPRRGVILISEKVKPLIKGNLLCAGYITTKHSQNQEVHPFGVGLSLGQTEAGNLLIGGSREFVGFDRNIHPEILAAIAEHALRIVPPLGRIRIIRTMVGFRPSTIDGLPILAEAPHVQGFFVAAGHEGDGIALAAVTGKIVAELVAGSKRYDHFARNLSLDRFKQPFQAAT